MEEEWKRLKRRVKEALENVEGGTEGKRGYSGTENVRN